MELARVLTKICNEAIINVYRTDLKCVLSKAFILNFKDFS